MATSVNVTTARPGGKEITKSLSNVNPAVTNNAISSFVGALNSLSQNSLIHIEKVKRSDVDLPENN